MRYTTTDRMKALLALLSLSTCAPSLAEILVYPVRNGAFDRMGGWGLPQHWRWHVVRGEHTYLHATDAPSGNRYVEVRTASGVARIYQTDIPVLEGSYRLTFRAKADGAGHVLLAAEGAGLASAPVGGFDAHRVASAVGLPPQRLPVLLVALGYPGAKPPLEPRPPRAEDGIRWERWSD